MNENSPIVAGESKIVQYTLKYNRDSRDQFMNFLARHRL
jgi:hypothetical protein